MASVHFDRKFGKEWIASVPDAPGVYRFINEAGKVFYVGKATSLRRRLRQYRLARARPKRDRKMARLVKRAVEIRWEVFPSELDACFEELRLIRELQPDDNVAGSYFFLYPYVGLCDREGSPRSGRGTVVPGAAPRREWRICLTSHPELFPGYRFHGAYRSRWIVIEAFFGLVALVRFVAAQVQPRDLVVERDRPHSYVFGFRQMREDWDPSWENFFRGRCDGALGELAAALLEKSGARAKAAEVQGHLRALARFWEKEAVPLAEAIRETGYTGYPVAQEERDPLFLRYRRGLSEETIP